MIFKISDKKWDEYAEWVKTHECSCRKDGIRYAGAIGGATTFEFTPTGLGDIVIAKCICGEKIDLTEKL